MRNGRKEARGTGHGGALCHKNWSTLLSHEKVFKGE